MASEKSPLIVVRSPSAIDELDDIWRWNAEHYGVKHADDYLNYLRASIGKLASDYASGKRVTARPDVRCILIERRSGGHGHVVVYKADEYSGEVRVLHVFHTAQDWPTKLADNAE